MIRLLRAEALPRTSPQTPALYRYTLPGGTGVASALVGALVADMPARSLIGLPAPVQDLDVLSWVSTGAVQSCAPPFPPEELAQDWLHALGTTQDGTPPTWTASQDSSLIQFHLLPETQDSAPEQGVRPAFSALEDGGFRILASGFAEDDPEDNPEATRIITDGAPLTVRSRTRLLHAALPGGEGAAYQTRPGRALFVLVVGGTVRLGENTLKTRDAALITAEEAVTVIALTPSVVLLVDSPLTPDSLL